MINYIVHNAEKSYAIYKYTIYMYIYIYKYIYVNYIYSIYIYLISTPVLPANTFLQTRQQTSLVEETTPAALALSDTNVQAQQVPGGEMKKNGSFPSLKSGDGCHFV